MDFRNKQKGGVESKAGEAGSGAGEAGSGAREAGSGAGGAGSLAVVVTALALLLWLVSCREQPVPKPYGYFRIAFPEKKYLPSAPGYPYRFEIPHYASMRRDSSQGAEPGWANIRIPGHKAEIHLSYKQVHHNLGTYTEESRRMAYDHTVKASAIEEQSFTHPAARVFGTIYYIRGNAASPLQFYLTDSSRHFLRGSLYIRATPNIDSLQPVIAFLEADAVRLMETLEWLP